MARFLKSPRKLGSAPKIYTHARKVRPYRRAALDEIVNEPGLNGPETRIAQALREMNITFTAQTPLSGGSYFGGARADFILTAYRVVLDFKGPWHFTAYGTGRDVLKDLVYQSNGLRRITLNDYDLQRLKPRIIEVIGVPL